VKKRLLWIGDACVPSGFARATHETLDVVCQDFDVTVLGLNYRGDPYNYPYDVYEATAGGDWAGLGRLIWMCDLVQPDVIVIQNDPWNIPFYIGTLRQKTRNYDGRYATVPVVAAIAVDGKNCAGAPLNDLALGVFWTQFGLDEARKGGFTKPGIVIPLGVDLNIYKPMPKADALRMLELPDTYNDIFIVGNVNRNQPRKRLDLTIKYFAEWVLNNNITAEQAALFLHVAPTGDTGVNIQGLMRYYGVIEYLLLSEPQMFYGKSEQHMAATYNVMDVLITTTQGEGMGLTTMEGMACRKPVIAPAWSALGDWAVNAAYLVPCTSTAVGPPYENVIGGIPDQTAFTEGLDLMYRDKDAREFYAKSALLRMQEDDYRWSNIGHAFNNALKEVVQ
jgi:D-inositol-3-phosphate glycosyltransferase